MALFMLRLSMLFPFWYVFEFLHKLRIMITLVLIKILLHQMYSLCLLFLEKGRLHEFAQFLFDNTTQNKYGK